MTRRSRVTLGELSPPDVFLSKSLHGESSLDINSTSSHGHSYFF